MAEINENPCACGKEWFITINNIELCAECSLAYLKNYVIHYIDAHFEQVERNTQKFLEERL